ncbi:helix-turn-helix domain-containing protein [Paenibacillus larvae]
MAQNKIGKVITQLRETRGMTRYVLAKKSSISYSYLTALEECKHNPSLEVMEKLAYGLNITLSELINNANVGSKGKSI